MEKASNAFIDIESFIGGEFKNINTDLVAFVILLIIVVVIIADDPRGVRGAVRVARAGGAARVTGDALPGY